MTTTTAQDPRAVRSREALIRATVTLLSERPTDKISATDLVHEAKVSRPTLYQHFGDLTSLVVTAVTAKMQQLFDETLPAVEADHAVNADGAGIHGLLERLLEQGDLFRNALHGSSGYPVMRAMSSLLATRLRNHGPVHQALDTGGVPEQLANFVGHGAVGIVADWLDVTESEREPADVVAQRLIDLLSFETKTICTTKQQKGA